MATGVGAQRVDLEKKRCGGFGDDPRAGSRNRVRDRRETCHDEGVVIETRIEQTKGTCFIQPIF